MSTSLNKEVYKNNQFWEYCFKLDSCSRLRSFKVTNSKLIKILKLWNFRYRQRKQLAKLDVRMLDDIGYTLQQAKQESKKYFWE